jgi:membrane-bound lytic murein transglycosylase A
MIKTIMLSAKPISASNNHIRDFPTVSTMTHCKSALTLKPNLALTALAALTLLGCATGLRPAPETAPMVRPQTAPYPAGSSRIAIAPPSPPASEPAAPLASPAISNQPASTTPSTNANANTSANTNANTSVQAAYTPPAVHAATAAQGGAASSYPNAYRSITPLTALPNWGNDAVLDAWPALLSSCQRLTAPAAQAATRSAWQPLCAAAASTPSSHEAARALLHTHLVALEQGSANGVATAYFEPIYEASVQRGGEYQWPVYAAPNPMTSLPREQLTPTTGTPHPSLLGRELAWLNNPIDPFLAQVQGSVRLRLVDGTVERLGYAAKNGQPYQAIATTLVRRGVFTANQASMERIKAWAVGKDAATVQAVLNTNPSFVFFKWLDLPPELGPIGALGVPLSPLRSVAVDTAHTPLGAPIWLDTQTMNGALQQLMLAQDVGSAIKGASRVDIYTGTGDAAGRLASGQKYPSKVWVLWPR